MHPDHDENQLAVQLAEGIGGSSGGGGYVGGAGDGDLALVTGAVSRPHRAVRPILL